MNNVVLTDAKRDFLDCHFRERTEQAVAALRAAENPEEYTACPLYWWSSATGLFDGREGVDARRE